MSQRPPYICCLDLDTFFVSVERLFDPSLEGKPVIVGGIPGKRGVVAAASYEVRKLGVRSGMALNEAVRRAPNAIFLPTRHETYGRYSKRVRQVAATFCPRIQIASIDELYLDFTGCALLYRDKHDSSESQAILRAVQKLTAAIQEDIGLPASAGIADNKIVSKVACGLAKPRGILMVHPQEAEKLLAPLPVRKLPGIGPVAEQKLTRLGVKTLGQLAELPPALLRRIFGRRGEWVKWAAKGSALSLLAEDRPAFSEYDPIGNVQGSISNERTFFTDLQDTLAIEQQLSKLAERVCWRARKRGVKAHTVTLKLRYADFHTITRARTIPSTSSELDIFAAVKDIYSRANPRGLPIRLLGIALSNLEKESEQLTLFGKQQIDQVMENVDKVRSLFGYDAIHLGTSLIKTKRSP